MAKINKLEQNPGFLEKLLITVGTFSIIVIITLTAITTYKSAKNDVLKTAEDDAVRVGEVMTKHYSGYLFNSRNKNYNWSDWEKNFFDRYVKNFLSSFDILKIKIFNQNHQIIYSNENDIIGATDKNNPGLQKALAGKITSNLLSSEEKADLPKEKRLHADVVETYFPIYNNNEKINGAMELYVDVTRYRKEILQRVTSSIVRTSIILILVFGISYFIVHLGTKELKKLLDRLYKMALYDTLTGLYNRGAIVERAEKELSYMKRQITDGKSPQCLGIIMIDIDHFKEINDTYGHHVGDEVLRGLSKRMNDSLRKYDIFGRYGGEEFLALLPNTGPGKTIVVAERLRKDLQEKPFIIDGKELKITASFGVTCCDDPDEGLDAMLQLADEALYEAKESGRNRVISK